MLAGSTNLANGFSFVAIVCEDPGVGRNVWRYVGSDNFNYNSYVSICSITVSYIRD